MIRTSVTAREKRQAALEDIDNDVPELLGRDFIVLMLPRLLDAELLTSDQMQVYVRVWEERKRTPGALINVPSHIGIVAQKPA